MKRSTKVLSTLAVTVAVALGAVGVVEARHGGDDPAGHGSGPVAGAVQTQSGHFATHPRHTRSLDDLPNHP